MSYVLKCRMYSNVERSQMSHVLKCRMFSNVEGSQMSHVRKCRMYPNVAPRIFKHPLFLKINSFEIFYLFF